MKFRILTCTLTLSVAAMLALTGCFDPNMQYVPPFLTEDSQATYTPPEETTTEAATEATTHENLDDITIDEVLPPSDDRDDNNEEEPEEIDDITNETFLKYTDICARYRPAEGTYAEYIYLYNFNSSMATGYGTDGSVVHAESDFGLKGYIEDELMVITVYDHIGTHALEAVYLQGLDASNAHENAIIQITTESRFKFDASSLKNGLYRVIAKFTAGNAIALYFYVNEDEVWFCEQASLSENLQKNYKNRRADLMRIIKEGRVTPENSLSTENILYPGSESDDDSRCDTQRWIDLSNTIVTDESWSDEYKLYRLQAWIRDNIAYDEFSSELEQTRAQYYGDFSGKYSAYDLRAGVSFDYANIVEIMCRAHGIPAITISSEEASREWNAVYVNNRWMEFDASMSRQYSVGEDVSERTKTANGIYDGIFSVMVWGNTSAIPSDAAANQDLSQDVE